MSIELIKYAFISGEWSPTLYGRTDLTKYDLGVALAYNWFVDYRGGLSTRPGTEFIDYIKDDDKDTIYHKFQFSPDLNNTYILLFGENYIRFIQNGAYVLEDEVAISSVTQASPGVITTSVAHGYTSGDWVKLGDVVGMTELNNRAFEVVVLSPTTYSLIDPGPLTALDTTGYGAYVSGGTSARVYEVASPYSAADLADLDVQQNRDLIRLTHPDHPIRNLVRNDHADWALSLTEIGNDVAAPTGLTTVPSAAGGASALYAVSAIMADGSESKISTPHRLVNSVNFTATAGSVQVSWDPVPGAEAYIVYRSNVIESTTPISAGEELGYLGKVRGTFLTDNNIVPDFTKGPYTQYDPFAPGAIDSVTITAGGVDYHYIAHITITGGGGTGFAGYGVVDESGAVTSVIITNRGEGYSEPLTVTVQQSGGTVGTGATATATVRDSVGTYPSISATFQQRQVYAASEAQPLTLWASQISRYNIFDTSDSVIDSDSYEFDVDSAEVSPLLHLFSMRGGLLMMSLTNIWLLTGGSGGGAVTPSNALADPQSSTGVSPVRPVKVGSDLLYIEGKGYSVRLLSYNDFSKVYSGEDKSILSNHLFTKTQQIVRWTFAENPHKIVWGTRSDGAIVAFTIVKEQDVYAWTWGKTKGLFKDILSITEDGVDRVYLTVRRLINGRWRKYIERLAIRDYANIEDAWAVDCGLKSEPAAATSALSISAEFIEDEVTYVTLTSPDPIFTGTVGWFVRASGGVFVINSVTSATEAKAVVFDSATEILPEDPAGRVLDAEAGDWTFGAPFKTFSGLWHLEGETLSLLGDGNVFTPQTVVNGQITLPDGVSKLIAGIKFQAIARTLPPTVAEVPIEARRKRVVGIAVRMHESRGLKVGLHYDNLYEFKERTNELWGEPIAPLNGYRYQILPTEWNEDGQTYFVQDQPLPATILGLVPDMEIGDDTD